LHYEYPSGLNESGKEAKMMPERRSMSQLRHSPVCIGLMHTIACIARQIKPGTDYRIGIQGNTADPLLQQPAGQV